MLRRFAVAVAAGISLVPAVASAAPPVVLPALVAAAPVLVEDWWEREGHVEELRDRYWHLSPVERARYDEIQGEIDRLEWKRAHDGDRYEARRIFEHVLQLRHEQHHILRWAEAERR
jgi:hypothetical protein